MEYAILGVVALLIGLGVGWYLGGRPAAELKARLAESEREAKETDAMPSLRPRAKRARGSMRWTQS